MTTPLLLTLGLIPSMFLLFVVLTTFSNSTRAYAAILLVPLALGLTIFILRFGAGGWPLTNSQDD
jgi:hypothetical protein